LAWDKATAIVPDGRKRAEAAAEVRRTWNQNAEEPRVGGPPASILRGAFAEHVQTALASDDKELRAHAFRAARAIGRLQDMKKLSSGVANTDPFVLNLQRGAYLCLDGNDRNGRAALLLADAGHYIQSPARVGLPQARLGLIACGHGNALGGDTRNVGLLYMPALKGLEASIGTVEGLDRVQVYLADPKTRLLGESRLRLSAFVIAETKPSIAEALAILVPKNDKGARLSNHYLRSPWLILDAHAPEQGVLVDLSAAKNAANYLETLLSMPPDGVLSCQGDACPAAAALANPMLTLREAASMLWLSRAEEAAKRGDKETTIESLGRAAALTPKRRIYQAAAIYLAVGATKHALDVLAGPVSQLKRHSLASQTRLLINESFARARNGEYVRAYNAAERAFSTSVHAESEAQAALGERLTDLAELEEDKVTAGWLWGAMALKVGKASNLGKRLEQTSSPSLAELAKWLKIAAMNEDERRPLRRKLVLPVKRLPKAAMPAALFVTGSVVPGTTDVEVWLDRLFAMQHLTQPIRMMLARAEAARWRGDAAVVRLWEGRAAASRKSMIDYRSTLLADFVQLR
jgi:hypothetical protein